MADTAAVDGQRSAGAGWLERMRRHATAARPALSRALPHPPPAAPGNARPNESTGAPRNFHSNANLQLRVCKRDSLFFLFKAMDINGEAADGRQGSAVTRTKISGRLASLCSQISLTKVRC
jgi:hypothetical protein